jgi:hypothetical protein
MSPQSQGPIRSQVLDLLRGGSAHAGFDDTITGIPPEQRGAKPAGAPHTPWQLLEHLRLAQWDILEFSRDPKHQSPKWPEGYWPASEAPPHEKDWDHSVAQFRRDLKAFEALIVDTGNDLLTPIPHAPDGQTLLREALLLADHNSYHLGQLILVRKMLGAWPSAE